MRGPGTGDRGPGTEYRGPGTSEGRRPVGVVVFTGGIWAPTFSGAEDPRISPVTTDTAAAEAATAGRRRDGDIGGATATAGTAATDRGMCVLGGRAQQPMGVSGRAAGSTCRSSQTLECAPGQGAPCASARCGPTGQRAAGRLSRSNACSVREPVVHAEVRRPRSASRGCSATHRGAGRGTRMDRDPDGREGTARARPVSPDARSR